MASDRGVVQSLDRALSILDVLAFSEDGMSLGSIAARTGLAKSTTHRLLSTLELRGFVSRDPLTGNYRSGLKSVPHLTSTPQIHEVLADLAAASGETANLGSLAGRDVVYVDRADSPHALRWQLGVGSRVPAYCSGLGKAILSHSPPDVVRRILTGPRRSFTESTITDHYALTAELGLTRRRGFAMDDQEFMDGVRCVAAPIVAGGEVVGAISLAGPAFRFTLELATAQAKPLTLAADRIAALMGERSGASAAGPHQLSHADGRGHG